MTELRHAPMLAFLNSRNIDDADRRDVAQSPFLAAFAP
jgi:hypothetical protein